MARPQLILPHADSGCGKAFYDNRHAAAGHRIALEFWNRATGHTREGYQLAVYRCKRCGGFHIGQKRIQKARPNFHTLHPEERDDPSEQAVLYPPGRENDASYPSY